MGKLLEDGEPREGVGAPHPIPHALACVALPASSFVTSFMRNQ